MGNTLFKFEIEISNDNGMFNNCYKSQKNLAAAEKELAGTSSLWETNILQ